MLYESIYFYNPTCAEFINPAEIHLHSFKVKYINNFIEVFFEEINKQNVPEKNFNCDKRIYTY